MSAGALFSKGPSICVISSEQTKPTPPVNGAFSHRFPDRAEQNAGHQQWGSCVHIRGRPVSPPALLSLTGVPVYLAIGLINTKSRSPSFLHGEVDDGGGAHRRSSPVFLSEPVFVFTFSTHILWWIILRRRQRRISRIYCLGRGGADRAGGYTGAIRA